MKKYTEAPSDLDKHEVPSLWNQEDAETANNLVDLPAALLEAIKGKHCRITHEHDTHQDLACHWQFAGFTVEAERRTKNGLRIDFAAPDGTGQHVGIEVKVKGTGQAIARQLLTYALTGEFSHLILITSRGLQGIPDSLRHEGRTIPVTVHVLCPL